MHDHHSHHDSGDGPRNIWVEDMLWIEDDGSGGLRLCFGQFGTLKETTPGHLDELPLPSAWIGEGVKPDRLDLAAQGDAFLLQGAAASDHVQAEDTAVSVMHATGRPGRKPVLCARWYPGQGTQAQLEPRLTLDIAPAMQDGRMRVLFRGRPLAGAILKALAQDGTVIAEPVSDESGEVAFSPPQPGLYQLVCSHTEKLPVCVGGHLYAGTRHWSTLTWRHGA